ncbi:MAG: hypothetical protein NW226_22685 [Microscillaceae bacterium]|nr:hypothetical protein [Microscillaceae bacterium]
MKIKQILWFFLLLILNSSLAVSCKPPKRSVKDIKNPYKLLAGTWYLNSYELYHKIYFQDSSHVGFDTHIDTVFFYNYIVNADTLELYDQYGDMVNQNIILKLDGDSLVFANLLDKEGIQRYSRIKSETTKQK